MFKYAQILNGKAHWIFDDKETLEVLSSRYASSVVLVDITDYKPMPLEGWLYSSLTGTFYMRDVTKLTTSTEPTAAECKQIKENIIHRQYREKLREVKVDYIEALMLDDVATQNAIKEEFKESNAQYKMQLSALKAVMEDMEAKEAKASGNT